MPLDECPKCSYRLGPPLKSSGRQVCMKCGWSDRPRQSAASTPAGRSAAAKPPKPVPEKALTPDEIQKILSQAAAMAQNNMKPKGKQDPSVGQSIDLSNLGE